VNLTISPHGNAHASALTVEAAPLHAQAQYMGDALNTIISLGARRSLRSAAVRAPS